MKNHLIVVSTLFALLLITAAFFVPRKNTLQTAYIPMKDNKGASIAFGDGWSFYSNEALGFSLEYPRGESAYEKLKPPELIYLTNTRDDNTRIQKNPAYYLTLSNGDFGRIVMSIQQTHFNVIDEWLAASQNSISGEMRVETISVDGYKALLTYADSDSNSHKQTESHVMFIKNGTIFPDGALFDIKGYGVKPEIYKRVWNSFRFNPLGDITGATTDLSDGWFSYSNKAFGFSMEYPGRKFAYGKLRPREDFYMTDAVDDIFQTQKSPSYYVNFSDGDSARIFISIDQTHFGTIDEWLAADPNYASGEMQTERMAVGGHDAVLTHYRLDAREPIPDEAIERRVIIIENGVFFSIGTRDIMPEEYRRVWRSFRLKSSLKFPTGASLSL